MKLRCKILPKYYDEIKLGNKDFDYRHLESITFVCKGRRPLEFEIKTLRKISSCYKQFVAGQYSDIPWDNEKPIYLISLGKRIK